MKRKGGGGGERKQAITRRETRGSGFCVICLKEGLKRDACPRSCFGSCVEAERRGKVHEDTGIMGWVRVSC